MLTSALASLMLMATRRPSAGSPTLVKNPLLAPIGVTAPARVTHASDVGDAPPPAGRYTREPSPDRANCAAPTYRDTDRLSTMVSGSPVSSARSGSKGAATSELPER